MTNHVLVIYNPTVKSQTQTEEWMGQLIQALNETGQYVVSFFPTAADTESPDLIPLLRPPLDLVIAAGGDGTIRFALAALAQAKSSIPLAVFPLGTGNVLARNLGVVEEKLFANPLEHAFKYVSQGTPMPLDLGMMNGEYFGGMAGVGPLSDAFMTPRREEKTSSKLLAYMKALLLTIAMRPRVFKITTGGKTFKVQASGIFISNVEDLGIGKSADLNKLNDGYLDLHIINPVKLSDYIALIKRYAEGVMSRNLSDNVIRVKEAMVEVVPRQGVRSSFQDLVNGIAKTFLGHKIQEPARTDKMRCMIDGDEYGCTPMRVTVVHHAVNVLIPPSKEAALKPRSTIPFPQRRVLPRARAAGE